MRSRLIHSMLISLAMEGQGVFTDDDDIVLALLLDNPGEVASSSTAKGLHRYHMISIFLSPYCIHRLTYPRLPRFGMERKESRELRRRGTFRAALVC